MQRDKALKDENFSETFLVEKSITPIEHTHLIYGDNITNFDLDKGNFFRSKKMRILIALLLVLAVPSHSTDVYAQDVYVISVQPKLVTIQQRQCRVEQVRVDNSGAGAVIGGIAGGVIGNQVKGSGKEAATAVGAITGAMVGSRIGQDQVTYENREVCEYVPTTVQQGETVTFSYRGRQFTHTFHY